MPNESSSDKEGTDAGACAPALQRWALFAVTIAGEEFVIAHDPTFLDRSVAERQAHWLVKVYDKLERCYQAMETHDRALLDEWMSNWSDLVDFEVNPVITSKEAAVRIAPRL